MCNAVRPGTYVWSLYAKWFGRSAERRIRTIVVLVILSGLGLVLLPSLAPHSPTAQVAPPFQAPGHGSVLGTDEVGRDLLTRVLYGTRETVLAVLVVVAASVIIGGAVGLAAGAAGSWLDAILMRITDAFLALPAPVVAIAIVSVLGPSLAHMLAAITFMWWPYYARIIRAEVRSLAARPYIEAARSVGIPPLRLWLRHLLPGTMPVLVVAASLDVGGLILTIAGLSFLGLGTPQPAPELGAMTAMGLPYLLTNWWVAVIPGLAIFLLTFTANVCGDALQQLLRIGQGS